MTRARPFIGVISDTHGLLREDVLEALGGAELIIHAGDIVRTTDLDRLKEIADTVIVRGNMDRPGLPQREIFDHRSRRFMVLHSLEDLDLDPASAGIHFVIHGHTHQPHVEERRGVTYLNPGSCGPERRNRPVSMAKLWADDWSLQFLEF